MVLSIVKAAIFGTICAIVAAHKGLGANDGPSGVSDAGVTSAVVTNFVLLFAANFVISQAQAMLFPGGIAWSARENHDAAFTPARPYRAFPTGVAA